MCTPIDGPAGGVLYALIAIGGLTTLVFIVIFVYYLVKGAVHRIREIKARRSQRADDIELQDRT